EMLVVVACGAGDLILVWQQVAKENGINLKYIIGIEPSVGMMEVGKKNPPDVDFIEAYATHMPLIDKSADITSISYG
ncbi:methyltransferase domain-containing protein, partial [Aliarcobacter butzleri]|uniref:methyltransferase domain-containing protein n=1 Tax=Aliarcobacter butzleri TaxID=28197 RepID=UPI003AF5374E